MLISYIIGMIISVLNDWYWYGQAKKGVEISNYPKEYFHYSTYKLFRSWVLWSLVWPVIFLMGVFDCIKNWRKS
jgi:hypothetical protein